MKRTIYRRKNSRTGKKERRWTIGYELSNGKMRYERAYTDKQASEQLLAQREREVARQVVGLTDPYEKHRKTPISHVLDEYLRDMQAKRVTSEHIRRTRSRLERAFEEIPARTIADLTMDLASKWVNDRVLEQGLALATRNHLVATLRAFGAWLVEHDKAAKNPLQKLRLLKLTDADRKQRSRVLTADELRRLAEAAPAARRILYLFAAYTGFRRGEDRATTWADLSIDGARPTVTIRGQHAKSGETVTIAIPTWLAGELRKWRAEEAIRSGGELAPSRHVFRVPDKIVMRLRMDAARAGLGIAKKTIHTTKAGNKWPSVEWIDPAGPDVTLKLHGLRAFYATTLFEAGIPLHDVQRLCRHSSITTTQRHYTAWRDSRMHAAVDSLPNPVSVPASVDGIPLESGGVRSSHPNPRARGGRNLA